MYFIPRNNRFYQYIAPTSIRRLYIGTFIAIGLFCIIGVYFIYYPLLSLVVIYNSERIMLQKKHDELGQLDKSIKELDQLITLKRSSIQQDTTSFTVLHHCHEQISFILDVIAQLGLLVHAYNVSKEKDKKWYVKHQINGEISGNKEKLMMFLDAIKKNQKMIIMSNIVINQKTDSLFHMNFEANLINIKKI